MPVTKSAQKALRKERRRTLVNARVRQQIKRVLKEAREKPSLKLLNQAASVLDQAAKKKVIPSGKADRLKSRLAKMVKKHQSNEKKTANSRKKTS